MVYVLEDGREESLWDFIRYSYFYPLLNRDCPSCQYYNIKYE